MSTYKYKDGNKQLIANHMEDIENASFRETMIKFHASSMVPVLKPENILLWTARWMQTW